MAVFVYRARSAGGSPVAGEIEAADSQAALAELRHRGLVVTGIGVKTGLKARPAPAVAPRRHHLGARDLVVFCDQLGGLLDAGVDVLSVLKVLIGQTTNRSLQRALIQTVGEVEGGSSLAEALAGTRVFPRLFVDSVRAGEYSGALAESLHGVAEHLRKEVDTRCKVAGAIAYPAVVFCVAFLMSLAMSVFVLPQYAAMFLKAGIELPLVTRGVLAASGALRSHFWTLVVAVVAAAVGLREMWANPTGRRLLQGILFRLPLLGALLAKAELALFSRKLATLTKRGVPLLKALEICSQTTGHLALADHLGAVIARIGEGSSFTDALGASALIPRPLYHMLRVGEHSGGIDDAAHRAAEYYDKEVAAAAATLSALAEPIALLFVAGLVSIIVISVALPMFEVANVFN